MGHTRNVKGTRMEVIIFDIDGTLANLDHRLHHIKNGNRRWDEFHQECVNDVPIEPIVKLNHMIEALGSHKIILVSGRSDIVRKETEEWLEKHMVGWDELHMRKDGDYRADDIIKSEILDQLWEKNYQILFTVDDRQRVVDMWRKRGITCLQAAAWKEDGYADSPIVVKKGLLTLMVGPSGAGKSSWLNGDRLINGQDCYDYDIHYSHIVSSDTLRKDLCGDFRDQTKNDQVFAALHAIVKTRINHGLPTVVDATNIKRADRLKLVEMAEGQPVRYIVIDRPVKEKLRDGEWRLELPFNLILKHDQTFQSQLKDILKGDKLPNVTVVDLRKL